ncbi:hypothetical protein LTR10_000543 [Elasticomyces elasticus]|nr:hypothetical protein LTR10_000543 [Elasticomyces elasticus]KAK4980209.1 hypothetical protein LTR42_000516 [Elasticomyces elasticus]
MIFKFHVRNRDSEAPPHTAEEARMKAIRSKLQELLGSSKIALLDASTSEHDKMTPSTNTAVPTTLRVVVHDCKSDRYFQTFEVEMSGVEFKEAQKLVDGVVSKCKEVDETNTMVGQPHEIAVELASPHDMYLGEEESREASTLPPVDGGRDAWLALAGAFCLEALIWGFPYCYGIFQTYYSTHEPFASEPAGIATISTTATAIMFMSAPGVALFVQRYPRLRRVASLVGLVVTCVALIAASFCNSTAGLLATQGVLFAVGGLFLYFPAMYVIDEWFVARKGLAFGVVWTGTGFSGAVVPWLLQWLLNDYGFRTTLRVWAVVVAVLSLPSIYFLKNRLPVTRTRTSRPMDWSFLKAAPFWIFQFGNVTMSLAYFLPSLWLPSFARSMGMPSFSGPLAVCLVNVAACFGYLLQGQLVDRYHVTIAIFMSVAGSVISIFLFWGFATTQPMLYIFALIWGLSGGGFTANWAGCATALKTSSNSLDTSMLISLMCVGKGIGSVVTGPISEALLQVGPWHGAPFAYGSQYGPVIVFTGATAMLGGTACLGKALKLL